MILRARVVLPITTSAINDGAVAISGRRIAAVGRWRDLSTSRWRHVIDLGNVALLPGLVNAHCHLDYTHLAGHLPPQKLFSDWLKLITSLKAGWTLSDYARSWRDGARMLFHSGTTTVVDNEALPGLLPEVWRTVPLRVISLLEMIGITNRRPAGALLKQATDKIRALGRGHCRAGLAPHAPYSTLPELLRLSAQAARRHRWPLGIHLAESALEFAMFTRGQGAMFDWLARSGRDMSDCGLGSPVQHLQRCRLLGPNLLATHVNYLARHDAALLAQNGVSVVHCPRSHFYFSHRRFPLRRLFHAGINVCLGTDSLASVYKTRRQTVELSMFDELRALARNEPGLSPRMILRMATFNGARALGLENQVGQLAPGALADLIAVPFRGSNSQPYDAVVAHSGHVAASMIDGRWALPPAASEPVSCTPRRSPKAPELV